MTQLTSTSTKPVADYDPALGVRHCDTDTMSFVSCPYHAIGCKVCDYAVNRREYTAIAFVPTRVAFGQWCADESITVSV